MKKQEGILINKNLTKASPPVCLLNQKLNLNLMKIVNLGNPLNSNNGMNKSSVEKEINRIIDSNPSLLNAVPLTGTTTLRPLTGNITFNGTAKITGIREPQTASDAVNFQFFTNSLNTSYANCLPLNGSVMTGNINMNGLSINNLGDSINTSDMINRNKYTELSTLEFDKLIPLSGLPTVSVNSIEQAITVNGSISGIDDPVNDTDAVNVKTLRNLLTTISNVTLYPLSGNIAMTGNLDMNGHTLTSIANPVSDTDAANLASLNTYLISKTSTLTPLNNAVMQGDVSVSSVSQNNQPSNLKDAVNKIHLNMMLSAYLPITGGSMTGNLNMNGHKITNAGDAVDNGDAVNLRNVNTLSDDYLKLTGTSVTQSITGNLAFTNTATITGISNPVSDTDAVNKTTLLQNLSSINAQYIAVSSSRVITEDLNMNSHKITNAGDAVDGTDGANLNNLQQTLSSSGNLLIAKSGGTMTSNLNMGNQKITGMTGISTGTTLLNNLTLNDTMNENKFLALAGGTITGEIMMSNQKITQNAPPVNPKDSLNLGTLNTSVLNYLPLSGTISGKPITGTITLSSTGKITGLSNPSTDSEAVNYLSLKNDADITTNRYLPLAGGTMTVDFNVNNNFINNLANGTSSALVNLGQVNQAISDTLNALTDMLHTNQSNTLISNMTLANKEIIGLPVSGAVGQQAVSFKQIKDSLSLLLPKTGGTMTGPIDMNNHKITGLNTGTLVDANTVSLKTMTDAFNNQTIDYFLVDASKALTGTLDMNGNAITNLAPATAPTDGATTENFSTLVQTATNPLFSLGEAMEGNLRMDLHTISTSKTNPSPTDLFNKGDMDSYMSPYLPIAGGTMAQNVAVNNLRVQGVTDASSDTDGATLNNLVSTLNTEKLKFMPLTGGTMTGDLNMASSFEITNLPTAAQDNQLISADQYRKSYVLLSGANPITGILKTGNNSFGAIPTPTQYKDPINYSYFQSKLPSKNIAYYSCVSQLRNNATRINQNVYWQWGNATVTVQESSNRTSYFTLTNSNKNLNILQKGTYTVYIQWHIRDPEGRAWGMSLYRDSVATDLTNNCRDSQSYAIYQTQQMCATFSVDTPTNSTSTYLALYRLRGETDIFACSYWIVRLNATSPTP
ncbi:MAG: hypothetical protein RR733_00280 [Victivallaceae bacterium]